MLNYKNLHYKEYQEMLPNGECQEISRFECFAPAAPPTAENPYKQRWYFSPDRHVAIRLPRNRIGDELGKLNAADLKGLERHEERKRQCVGNSGGHCPIVCERCPLFDECESDCKVTNGKSCHTKCGVCSVSVNRTIELDKSFQNCEDLDLESRFDIADDAADITAIMEDRELLSALFSVLDRLSPEDQELWDCLRDKVKKQEVADKLGLTLDGVRYREQRLFKILRSDPALKIFFEN